MARTQKWIYKDGENETKVVYTKPIFGFGAKIEIDGISFPLKGVGLFREHEEPFRLLEQMAVLHIDKCGKASIKVDNEAIAEAKEPEKV